MKRVGQYYKYYDNVTFAQLAYGPVRMELDLGAATGAGCMVSTPQQVERFWRVLFNGTMQGRPLLQDPRSLEAILHPWTKLPAAWVRMLWSVGKLPVPAANVSMFYTQGLITVYVNLPAGGAAAAAPSYLYYIGGTFSVVTANILDVRDHGANSSNPGRRGAGTMAQVWTSSLLSATTGAALVAARAAQDQTILEAKAQWGRGVPQPHDVAWRLMFEYQE